jgi:hypothetical protein
MTKIRITTIAKITTTTPVAPHHDKLEGIKIADSLKEGK